MSQRSFEQQTQTERLPRRRPVTAVRATAVAVAALLAGGLSTTAVLSCGALQDPPTAARLTCYAAADRAAQARVDAECAEVPFDECPAARDILEQLQREQEVCP